jgi:hypothetical protein
MCSRPQEWNLQRWAGMEREDPRSEHARRAPDSGAARHYEQTKLMGTRRSRAVGVVLLAIAAVALGAFLVWLSPGGEGGFEAGMARTQSGQLGAIGTAGQEPGSTTRDNSGPALTTIHELETITGATDGHELVGRKVDLHVPIQQHINDVAFWVGPRDNRLLVVLARDNRDAAARQEGRSSNTGAARIDPGQQATISGTIERVPYAEAMYSWGLTNADRAELMDRRIYLRADRVTGGGS